MAVRLEIDIIPLPAVIIAEFDKLGLDIRSFRVPLHRSIKEVMAPSFRANFDFGGRPAWPPLAASTIAKKGHDEILVESGRLHRKVGQINLWTIHGQEGYAAVESLPGDIHYGIYHQTGTINMPDRPWAVIQPEDIDDIERVFEEWLQERIIAAGFVGA